MAEMTLKELAELLGGELTGDGGKVVRGMASLEAAQDDEVAFLANTRYEKHVADSKAAAVIVAEDYAGAGASLIRCKDPYFAFRNAMVKFYGFRRPHFQGVDARACVDPTAKLAPNVHVAPFAVIGPGAVVGEGTAIYSGACVGPNCRIGRDCALHPNVTLYEGCILGDRVIIHAGSSIGQDGFGFATHGGRHEKIPAAGWVELQDDVEIGACCALDRATMGVTVIGAGTKFSNGVIIGHGTKLGRHCLMSAQSGIAGSTTVGNYCVFGAQSGVINHLQIGDQARIGAQSGVTANVEPKQDVLGSPAIPIAKSRRVLMSLQYLPELRQIVSTLVRELKALKHRLDERGSQDGAGAP